MRGFFFVSAALAGAAVDAAPFRPQDDATVLERLPRGFLAPPRSAKALDPDVAMTLARAYIERSRAEGDPRPLGYAQGVLAPWWNALDAPPEIILLRATIKQARHDFDAALVDLDAVIARRPESAQAWLTRATILKVQGKYPQAGTACSRLRGIADDFVAELCRASIDGLSNPQAALDQLGTLRLQESRQPTGVRAWFASELAESYERAGRWADAGDAYRIAREQFPDDLGLRIAGADFLLSQSRPREVLALTEGRERIDALRLRDLIARGQLHESRREDEDVTASAFEAAHRRGEDLHLREEARFVLEVKGDPALALALAQRNWSVQHEFWDVRLLLQCALAARQPQAAQPALDWMRGSGFRDVRLVPLLDQLGRS